MRAGLRDALAERFDGERSRLPRRPPRRYLLELIATAAACYAAARIGLELAYPHDGASAMHGAFTAFWPPIGVGIAALVLFGPRLWPGVVAGDLLAGDYSAPFAVVAGQTLATVIAVVVASRCCSCAWARARPGLRVKDVIILIVCSAVGTILGATCGLLAIWIFGDLPAGSVERIWRTWWLSDLAGALVVTPALLTWFSARLRPTRRELIEGIALLAALVAADEHLVAARRAVRRVPGPDLGGPPLRPLGRRDGPAGHGGAHRLAHVRRLGAVRPQLADRQPARDAAVPGRRRADLDGARRRDRRARRERGRRARPRARAGRAAPHRHARRHRGRSRRASSARSCARPRARSGVASASIVRYDDPSRVCVMGGWSETGRRCSSPSARRSSSAPRTPRSSRSTARARRGA